MLYNNADSLFEKIKQRDVFYLIRERSSLLEESKLSDSSLLPDCSKTGNNFNPYKKCFVCNKLSEKNVSIIPTNKGGFSDRNLPFCKEHSQFGDMVVYEKIYSDMQYVSIPNVWTILLKSYNDALKLIPDEVANKRPEHFHYMNDRSKNLLHRIYLVNLYTKSDINEEALKKYMYIIEYNELLEQGSLYGDNYSYCVIY